MRGHAVRQRGFILRLIVGIAALLFGLGFAGGAGATADDEAGEESSGTARPQVILGAVRDQYKDDTGKKIVDNVSGVEVIITTEAGEEIARMTTDDKGEFRTEVPTAGNYIVEINSAF